MMMIAFLVSISGHEVIGGICHYFLPLLTDFMKNFNCV